MVKNCFSDTIAILYTWNLFVLYFGGRTLQKKALKQLQSKQCLTAHLFSSSSPSWLALCETLNLLSFFVQDTVHVILTLIPNPALQRHIDIRQHAPQQIYGRWQMILLMFDVAKDKLTASNRSMISEKLCLMEEIQPNQFIGSFHPTNHVGLTGFFTFGGQTNPNTRFFVAPRGAWDFGLPDSWKKQNHD